MMKWRRWWPLIAVMVVGAAQAAFADQTPFDLTSARAETRNIVQFLLGALMSILGVAGGATIVHGLVTARKHGEWSEFLGGVAMAIIAFIAFVGFLKMGNISANPNNLMTDFQIK